MDKLELLQKIKKLAENGRAGEKENAQSILNNLMKKYNITDEDLNEDIIKDFEFKIHGKIERRLLGQIAFSVYGNVNDKKGSYCYTYIKNKMLIKCTDAEFIEIKAKFEFYKAEYKKQLSIFYDAFIQANSIFPNEKLCKPKDEKYFLSEEDKKILKMANGIEKSNFRKCLEYEE